MKDSSPVYHRASPRLKDATIPSESLSELYLEMVVLMRRLYHSCKLVHADLSEYNILYHSQHLYVIDVSQSVEHDHPHALDFLRADITNIEEFWAKRGVKTLGLRRTFEFIVSDAATLGLSAQESSKDARLQDGPQIGILNSPQSQPTNDTSESSTKDNASETHALLADGLKYKKDDSYEEMECLLLEWLTQDPPETTQSLEASASPPIDAAQEDAVFRSSYIPRNLTEVVDPERDVNILARGEGKTLIYGDLTGVVKKYEDDEKARTSGIKVDVGDAEEDEHEKSTSEGGSDSDEEETEESRTKKTSRRDEDKEAKKVNRHTIRSR